MKKLIKYIIIPALAGLIVSCNEIDVPITTQMTPDVFPQNDAQYAQTAGAVYSVFRGEYAHSIFFMSTISSDEGILPARGGNWYDNGGYLKMHYHTWDKDHGATNSIWGSLEKTIGVTNQAYYLLNNVMPEGTNKKNNFGRIAHDAGYFVLHADGLLWQCAAGYSVWRFHSENKYSKSRSI